MNLKIFNSEYNRYDRYYNYFWDKLIDCISKYHNVTEFRDASDFYDNSGINQIEKMQDSDLLVLNENTGCFVVFSCCDILQPEILSFKHHDKFKKIFLSQYFDPNIRANALEQYENFSPWIYFPCFVEDLDQYYFMRKYEKNEFIDKLFFKGTAPHRPILNHFLNDFVESADYSVSFQEYSKTLIKFKAGLSLGGRGEFCYRDIEYMAMGLPMLIFEYQSKMLFPLIPNYHYISLDIPKDLPQEEHRDNLYLDRLGDKHHAEMLERRFLEVKDDKDFLDYISNNARKYYEEYLSPEGGIRTTIDLIEKELS